jgi:trk system potassium uptake protein TrkA
MPASRNVAVIGLGTFGSAVARHLARFGDHVMGVDSNEAAVSSLDEDLSRAVITDARDIKALKEAGLGSYDVAVVCMATNIEANILAVMNAKDLGVPQVWAKSSSSTHARILTQIGVHRTLSPEETYGELVAQALHNPLMRGSVRLTEGLHFAQIETPTRFVGRRIAEVRFGERHDLDCLGILRDGRPRRAAEDEAIENGDTLLLVGTRQAMRLFADKG